MEYINLMKLAFELYRATSKADVGKNKKLILNSNDRLHFQQKAKIVRFLRLESHLKVMAHFQGKGFIGFDNQKPCTVTVTVFSPTKRRIDPDNFQPTVKALMDGITDSGLWTDDSHEIVKWVKYQFGGTSGNKAYRIELEIKGYENDK